MPAGRMYHSKCTVVPILQYKHKTHAQTTGCLRSRAPMSLSKLHPIQPTIVSDLSGGGSPNVNTHTQTRTDRKTFCLPPSVLLLCPPGRFIQLCTSLVLGPTVPTVPTKRPQTHDSPFVQTGGVQLRLRQSQIVSSFRWCVDETIRCDTSEHNDGTILRAARRTHTRESKKSGQILKTKQKRLNGRFAFTIRPSSHYFYSQNCTRF